MNKILSVLSSVLSSVAAWAKANPALAAGAVSAVVTLLARFGLRLDANQLAVIASLVAAVTHGVVHAVTTPAGKHESAPREQHS
jgi:hypothetical protein